MADDRTPHWLIQARFLLLCSPVGIVLAIILAPWAIIVLPVFFGTLLVFWQGSRLFTNGFVKLVDPKAHEAIKQNGGDPFYDSLGSPLNTDTQRVRVTGRRPNASCPGCQLQVSVQANTPFRCSKCDAHWHENNWWRWTGSKWIVLKMGR
ncbi:hypothetical protein [Rubinisphaera brasiliensis]|uniref:Uncharacterized protein n=1 Tax=Rubinisphaera brasiliensis (strain ATCC 49424 / DSM 5305 / JCM 21570 / IAM 15109 / NBRC 103401 / IFAM 1448) TaxID=756272 RepID=F0SLP4_RUBBR|nr:hypothetical protein [Rubinisphaera brasiliensis]ADY58785.1 hypothetical protein Plabr_1169 [Rubinisphaera brasiliensis DSM 5305]